MNDYRKAIVVADDSVAGVVLLDMIIEDKGRENVQVLVVDYNPKFWVHPRNMRLSSIITKARPAGVLHIDTDYDLILRQPEDNTMFVPYRAGVELALAVSMAYSLGVRAVYYPSCRVRGLPHSKDTDDTGFNVPFANSVIHATESQVTTLFPLERMFLEDVIRVGAERKIDFSEIWSCNHWDRLVHCGKCAGCLTRKLAFKVAEVEDGTEYAK